MNIQQGTNISKQLQQIVAINIKQLVSYDDTILSM